MYVTYTSILNINAEGVVSDWTTAKKWTEKQHRVVVFAQTYTFSLAVML